MTKLTSRLARSASPEDVEVALKDGCVSFPITDPTALIEAYTASSMCSAFRTRMEMFTVLPVEG